jgi:glycosyltransferase involved in cell wall biosynthesis
MTAHPQPRSPKVLFLSGLQIYPPLSGGNLRSFGLANALKHHGLGVFVYSLVGRKNDYLARRPSSVQVWPEGIEEYVDRRGLWFLTQYASYWLALPPVWITAYLRAAAVSPGEKLLPALLREKLAWCDTVVADFPFVHPVFGAPSARGKLRVVSTHNIEHHLYDDQSQWRNRRLRPVVRGIELKAAAACDVLVSCCPSDADFFAAHTRVRQSVVVPNGIDVRRFHGIQVHRARTRQELGIADDVRLFLFTASKWGPNREAFDYLVEFAQSNRRSLVEEGIHILVVGNVVAKPIRLPGFTATGKVDIVDPYFAAADAALNPIDSGAGTNVKMGEFIAARLPILTTPFGARGFRIEDGRTGFVFHRDGLAPVLSKVRRLFEEDSVRLRLIAEEAYAQNQSVIDMNTCARPLVEALNEAHQHPLPAEDGIVAGARAPSV